MKFKNVILATAAATLLAGSAFAGTLTINNTTSIHSLKCGSKNVPILNHIPVSWNVVAGMVGGHTITCTDGSNYNATITIKPDNSAGKVVVHNSKFTINTSGSTGSESGGYFQNLHLNIS